jgi:hypothetical protein
MSDKDYFILGYCFEVLVEDADGNTYVMKTIAENYEKAGALMEKYISHPHTILYIRKVQNQNFVIDVNFVK